MQQFVILDTQHFGGDPVAMVAIPHAIPLGFHGNLAAVGTGLDSRL